MSYLELVHTDNLISVFPTTENVVVLEREKEIVQVSVRLEATGLPGPDGKSAYQVWLDQGNTGTVTDYLNSLKSTIPGPEGPQGNYYQPQLGDPYVAGGRVYVGKDFPSVFPNGSVFFKEVV